MFGMNKPFTWHQVCDDGYSIREIVNTVSFKGRIQRQAQNEYPYQTMGSRGTTSAWVITQDLLDFKNGDIIKDEMTKIEYAIVGVNKQASIYGNTYLYFKVFLTPLGLDN